MQTGADRRMPPAWLTQALVLVNVAVFVAMLLDGAGLVRPDPLVHIAWGSNFGPLTTSGDWWRLATATFLHFGALHLFFNMWALWASGALVERLFGPGRFALIYAASGLAGSLASVTWNPLVNSAGASAAIFGVFGAQLAFFLRGGHGIPAEVVRAQRNSTLTFIGYSVVFGLTVPGIDNAAHLGGLATGTGMGWLLARPLGARDGRRQGSGAVMLALVLATLLMAAGWQAALASARAHADERAYMLAWHWYASSEGEIVARTNAVLEAARSRKLGDAQVADRLEEEVLPRWVEARDRLGAVVLPQSSPLHGDQARLLEFTGTRVRGFRLMIEGIRANDRSKLERAVGELERAGGVPPSGR